MTAKDEMPADGEGVGVAAAETDGPEAEAVAVLEAEKIDLKDRLMRALAETENVRRRSEREAADARTYAVTGFARDMLNVADNIRRALASAPSRDAASDEDLRKLVEGIELTERDLLATLGRHGVKPIEPEGQKFDPNLHQAMFEVPNADLPNGTVVQVVQGGYVIGERVLRPALVGVSKGGSRPGAASAPADGESDRT